MAGSAAGGASKPDMSVDLGGIAMKNPINTASGTYGFGREFVGFYDVARLGAITCKGCSAEPWEGNPAPRMWETASGLMNGVGLQNPGVRAMLESEGAWLRELQERGCAVIVQAAGHAVEEYVRAVELYEELAPWAAGIELNVSCPNIAAGGAAMGSTPEGAAEVVRAVRSRTRRPLVVKMAPTRVPEIARALEDAGADALSLINTIPAMAIDVRTRRSRLARPTAGLSGPAIHPIAVRMVWEAHNACSLPLCGIGGVTCGADAAEFILAGASAVSVGTANLTDPTSAPRIAGELEAWVAEQGASSVRELVGAFEG
jgi:dihydroorotate dehydrogenase (NAD+) catalytic subunit